MIVSRPSAVNETMLSRQALTVCAAVRMEEIRERESGNATTDEAVLHQNL